MTCSVQLYRIRIGMHNQCRKFLGRKINYLPKNTYIYLKFCLTAAVVMSSFLIMVLFLLMLTQYNFWSENHKTSTVPSKLCQYNSWDPMSTVCVCSNMSCWLTKVDRNKMAHILYGNRNLRGKGVTCLYWNKGSSLLQNKMHEINDIIESHKPLVFGLGEANFKNDHDIENVKIPGYTLHLDPCFKNPHLGVARVVVYTHSILRVKRRNDLEDNGVAAIWLEIGLPSQKSFLICMAYRQWQLLNQMDNSSATVSAQLERWEQSWPTLGGNKTY